MQAADITYQGRFQTQTGDRLVDVFARAAVDKADDHPVMVQALSGTGLPTGQSIMRPAAAVQARPGVGVALFFCRPRDVHSRRAVVVRKRPCFPAHVAGVRPHGEHSAGGKARSAAAPGPAPAASAPINCDPSPPSNPLAYSLGPQAWQQNEECVQRYAEAQKRVAAGIKPDGWLEWYASAALNLTGSDGWTVSLVLPLALALASFAVLFVACGYGIVGLGWVR